MSKSFIKIPINLEGTEGTFNIIIEGKFEGIMTILPDAPGDTEGLKDPDGNPKKDPDGNDSAVPGEE